MCERRKDDAGAKEPLPVYWIRCLAEMLYQRPASFVAIGCCVALYYTYRDLQSANERAIDLQQKMSAEQQQFLERQTSAMVKITQELTDMNATLRKLEKSHETSNGG
ncbi:MAG: hypothetical protein Q3986_06515 [Akkermansia sp.]|nr:hypothetical protein [Akkermansia sp.]